MTQDTFTRTAAYVSGGICGRMWWPQSMGGLTINENARGPWGFFDCFTEPASFRDALDSLLMKRGGDFQHATFTADTVFRVERKRQTAPGKYEVHIWERPISALPDCSDLVNAECFTGDFMGED